MCVTSSAVGAPQTFPFRAGHSMRSVGFSILYGSEIHHLDAHIICSLDAAQWRSAHSPAVARRPAVAGKRRRRNGLKALRIGSAR